MLVAQISMSHIFQRKVYLKNMIRLQSHESNSSEDFDKIIIPMKQYHLQKCYLQWLGSIYTRNNWLHFSCFNFQSLYQIGFSYFRIFIRYTYIFSSAFFCRIIVAYRKYLSCVMFNTNLSLLFLSSMKRWQFMTAWLL